MPGNTINLVSNDAQKVERSLNQLGMALAAPLELTISLAILWYLIGWEALAGAAIFFVLVTFQMLMARKAAKLRDKAATFTDRRLVVMNEIISGIRAVKMHAWEWNFRDAVCDLRRYQREISDSEFNHFVPSHLLAIVNSIRDGVFFAFSVREPKWEKNGNQTTQGVNLYDE